MSSARHLGNWPPSVETAKRFLAIGRRTLRSRALLIAGVLVCACSGSASGTRPSGPDAAVVPTAPPVSTAPAGLRDKYRQPFASTSIWNMPVGANAEYVPAGIERTDAITVDEEYWIVTDPSMPLRPLFTNATFGPGRCAQVRYEYDLSVPDSLSIPDAREGSTPNNAAAFLLPDGRTIRQMNPLSRCAAGGPVTAGWLADTVDIYGDGILGGHGGSHLSSIGGSIRLGEFGADDDIRHALKINLDGHRFLSRMSGGYRWPATAADASALADPANVDSYNGSVPALRMGSLLAIPPDVDIGDLGLRTAPARKLAWTLQNYGAYVVDDTSRNVDALDIEAGVPREFRSVYGFDIESNHGAWYDDAMRLFDALAVVDNNAPDAVSGGGSPIQPLAAPIGN